jgi:hypothetical protein
MLSGVLYCGRCGGALHHRTSGGHNLKRDHRNPPVYSCPAKPAGCGRIAIQDDRIEPLVEAMVLEALSDAKPSPGEGNQRANHLQENLVTLNDRQRDIAEALGLGKITVDLAAQAQETVLKQIRETEDALRPLLAKSTLHRRGTGDVRTLWGGMSTPDRRSLIKDVIEKITVKAVGRGWRGEVLDRLEIAWRL